MDSPNFGALGGAAGAEVWMLLHQPSSVHVFSVFLIGSWRDGNKSA